MKVLTLFFLSSIVVGCAAQSSDETRLYDSIGQHLEAAKQAHEQAAELWDQLIIEGSITCATGLGVPTPLQLTVEQATQYPVAASVRDLLNQAIERLQVSSQQWDALCTNPGQTVSPSQANTGYLAAKTAKTTLELAENVYSTWEP
jgi:hypothetical protein